MADGSVKSAPASPVNAGGAADARRAHNVRDTTTMNDDANGDLTVMRTPQDRKSGLARLCRSRLRNVPPSRSRQQRSESANILPNSHVVQVFSITAREKKGAG